MQNVTYYYGTSLPKTKGARCFSIFCILRGDALKSPAAKKILRANRYHWKKRRNVFQMIMGYVCDETSIQEIKMVLLRLQGIGCNVIPSANLNPNKHLNMSVLFPDKLDKSTAKRIPDEELETLFDIEIEK